MTRDDIDALFEIFSDEVAMRYWSSAPMRSKDEAVELLESIEEFAESGELLEWGVFLNDEDRLIGTVTLADIDEQNRRSEIGFAQNRAFWGKGYMGEALTTILDHAFGAMKLHRIEADVDPGNEGALRLLEKLGFQREGLLRERWIVDGQVADTVFLGLLAREWAERRG